MSACTSSTDQTYFWKPGKKFFTVHKNTDPYFQNSWFLCLSDFTFWIRLNKIGILNSFLGHQNCITTFFFLFSFFFFFFLPNPKTGTLYRGWEYSCHFGPLFETHFVVNARILRLTRVHFLRMNVTSQRGLKKANRFVADNCVNILPRCVIHLNLIVTCLHHTHHTHAPLQVILR